MGFKYYCTHCAALVDQNKELFDMQKLLIGSAAEAKLQILKFRLTGAEVLALYNSGIEEGNDTRRCTLTLQSLMGYIANENNLNVPSAKDLTMEQLNAFINANDVEESSSGFGGGGAFGGGSLFDDDEPEEQENEKTEKDIPEAIQEMIKKDSTTDSKEFGEGRLRDDLQIVKNRLSQNESYTFSLRLEYEEAVDNTKVLVGMVITEDTGVHLPLKNRVCPSCGSQVFDKAGTAEHKSVVFIGSQSSGKTSTILAMTHYTQFHMVHNEGNVIWNGASCLDHLVDDCELLTKLDRLDNDLARYSVGYAPPKTEASKRTDAYSATFYVSSMKGSRKRILTLMDLPGELCLDGGGLQTEKILNNFPVAMACDTFIVCFDTTTLQKASASGAAAESMLASNEKIKSAHQTITDTCKWADEFQKLLVKNGQKKTYVPAMLLFTKCRELEAGEEAPAARQAVNAIRNCYLFRKEEGAISSNSSYKHAMDQFQMIGGLKQSFHAVLRSSPYGYAAPAYDVANRNPELKETVHAPTPKNLDSLMRWVLMVSGCIPVVGEYRPKMGSNENAYSLKYFVGRPQFRKENPECENLLATHKDMCQEAMARCVLFANPGCHDMGLVRNYRVKLNMVQEIMESNRRMAEDSNDLANQTYK